MPRPLSRWGQTLNSRLPWKKLPASLCFWSRGSQGSKWCQMCRWSSSWQSRSSWTKRKCKTCFWETNFAKWMKRLTNTLNCIQKSADSIPIHQLKYQVMKPTKACSLTWMSIRISTTKPFDSLRTRFSRGLRSSTRSWFSTQGTAMIWPTFLILNQGKRKKNSCCKLRATTWTSISKNLRAKTSNSKAKLKSLLFRLESIVWSRPWKARFTSHLVINFQTSYQSTKRKALLAKTCTRNASN